MKYNIFCDGGARGNPGPAAIGVVIKDAHHQVIKTIGQTIGAATNNQAEYRAVLAALNWLKNQPPAETTIFLDSQLLVEQLNGNYKVKNSELKNLHSQARALIMELGGKIGFQYIPRERNRPADQLVNEALDKN